MDCGHFQWHTPGSQHPGRLRLEGCHKFVIGQVLAQPGLHSKTLISLSHTQKAKNSACRGDRRGLSEREGIGIGEDVDPGEEFCLGGDRVG